MPAAQTSQLFAEICKQTFTASVTFGFIDGIFNLRRQINILRLNLKFLTVMGKSQRLKFLRGGLFKKFLCLLMIQPANIFAVSLYARNNFVTFGYGICHCQRYAADQYRRRRQYRYTFCGHQRLKIQTLQI